MGNPYSDTVFAALCNQIFVQPPLEFLVTPLYSVSINKVNSTYVQTSCYRNGRLVFGWANHLGMYAN